MSIRDKAVRLSLISTVIQGIALFFTIGFSIVLVVLTCLLAGMIGKSAGLMENVNPDDVTAGWQVLFGAAGSFFGAVVWMVLLILLISLIGPVIAETLVCIYGIRTYKKRNTPDFKRMVKNDSIIKLVINAVTVIVFIFAAFSMESSEQTIASLMESLVVALLITLPSIACTVVSIVTLQKVNDIEELPEESEQQYIEYYEDKTPYFGQ